MRCFYHACISLTLVFYITEGYLFKEGSSRIVKLLTPMFWHGSTASPTEWAAISNRVAQHDNPAEHSAHKPSSRPSLQNAAERSGQTRVVRMGAGRPPKSPAACQSLY
jgi:hypothetical protein